MSIEKIEELAKPQRDRLAFIDLCVNFLGEIRRQDIVARFEIQAAAATRDIALYKELTPHNLEYNPKGKVYIRGERFRPIFDFPVERVMSWISQGLVDGHPTRSMSFIPCETPIQLNTPNLEILSAITRSIQHKQPIEITYMALSSGLTTREVVPFALANNGIRWHVRAYDRKSKEFRDFVLTRITNTHRVLGAPEENELSAQDIQWNRIVELELVPHPANVKHPDTIEKDYGMVDGKLNIQVRAALVGYMLLQWNVDCTIDHSLKGAEYHLWLRNRQTLYGVSNVMLAPGYEPENRV